MPTRPPPSPAWAIRRLVKWAIRGGRKVITRMPSLVNHRAAPTRHIVSPSTPLPLLLLVRQEAGKPRRWLTSTGWLAGNERRDAALPARFLGSDSGSGSRSRDLWVMSPARCPLRQTARYPKTANNFALENSVRMYPGDGTLKSGDQKCAVTSQPTRACQPAPRLPAERVRGGEEE